MSKHPLNIAVLTAFALFVGCTRFDPARVRHEQTDSFTNTLAQLALSDLSKPLSLDDCIRIAMTNNYEIRQADLNRELARLGKNVAFTAFLPNVAASAGYNAYEKDPVRTEKRFETASLEIAMPIFMPATWFLYAATRHGYASAEIAANYVRQIIVLQTTVNYFNVLVQQDTVAALESQLNAARENADRVQGLVGEGFFAAWEGDEALYIAESRETELNRARRQLIVLRGELLQGLGLSPASAITLSGDTGQAAPPAGSTDDLVLQALEIHPELSIADRQVVISEHQVRQAFCNFLPVISVFSTGSWTTDDLAAQSANWLTGFKGAWNLFTGFANLARYRAAKVQRQKTELERESTFLSIMIQVVAAEAAVRDAAETARIRQRAYEVASAKYADYNARAAEGLKPLSDALDALAVMDFAQVALVRSRYQERIAIANLELAMGLTLTPQASNKNEGK